MNLLDETITELQGFEKKPCDVLFVSYYTLSDNKEHWCTWDEFTAVADEKYWNYQKYPSRPFKEVNGTLKIVGDNWWMECREKHNRFEVWEFKVISSKSDNHHVPEKIDLFPYWSNK